MTTPLRPGTAKLHARLSETIYQKLKQDIFDFQLLPGDRLVETDLAGSLGVSRTPLRQALYRLEQEGYLKVAFRNGWNVLPFDFDRFEQLYDFRIIIEMAAIQQICDAESAADLAAIASLWLVEYEDRLTDARTVSENDEAFHQDLVIATGNAEMARVHRDITEKIRIIRRLDFTKTDRINATYDEHAKILRLLMQRKTAEAKILLRSHIEASKAEVRKITLHMLHSARQKGGKEM